VAWAWLRFPATASWWPDSPAVHALAEDWRIEYNTDRPHGLLGGPTSEAYRQHWIHDQERLS